MIPYRPTVSTPQSSSRSVHPFLQDLSVRPTHADRQTDRRRYIWCSNRPHLASAPPMRMWRRATNQRQSACSLTGLTWRRETDAFFAKDASYSLPRKTGWWARACTKRQRDMPRWTLIGSRPRPGTPAVRIWRPTDGWHDMMTSWTQLTTSCLVREACNLDQRKCLRERGTLAPTDIYP